ncbi:hypothetical protein EVAR_41099_1 [Eumeta japonica]|uniref:Uncharacterized protein n=1 Tax=Eumeta variegata TaxID=151549 RepID=A0A4C1XCE4_EUMVA|nr:hypothetical protein EVAR_41099_1 [Eumeta japonica]
MASVVSEKIEVSAFPQKIDGFCLSPHFAPLPIARSSFCPATRRGRPILSRRGVDIYPARDGAPLDAARAAAGGHAPARLRPRVTSDTAEFLISGFVLAENQAAAAADVSKREGAGGFRGTDLARIFRYAGKYAERLSNVDEFSSLFG